MDEGYIMEAIKLLTKCVQLRRKALFKGHPDLGKSTDMLAQCYAFIGNFISGNLRPFLYKNFSFQGNMKNVKKC